MVSKIDLQLFRASLRVISAELQSLSAGILVPERVFQELSCMDLVIRREQDNDRALKWLGGIAPLNQASRLPRS